MRVLDLFCGRWGWSRAFVARGWTAVGIDLVEPPEVPAGCEFQKRDVLDIDAEFCRQFDFVCASSPCEQFSVHGMKHFHPNPPYPELGIKLFEHTRKICEESGVPYVMENVRPAQQFVGRAAHHCGPFYLWGTGVPLLLNQGIRKGISMGADKFKNLGPEERRALRKQYPFLSTSSRSPQRKALTAQAATIPPELANSVAEYAERILEANHGS